MNAPGDVMDDAAVNMYRLRPSAESWQSSLETMRDLALMWRTAERIQSDPWPRMDAVFEFKASKTQLEKLEAAQREAGRSSSGRGWPGMDEMAAERAPARGPREMMARHNVVEHLTQTYAVDVSQ